MAANSFILVARRWGRLIMNAARLQIAQITHFANGVRYVRLFHLFRLDSIRFALRFVRSAVGFVMAVKRTPRRPTPPPLTAADFGSG